VNALRAIKPLARLGEKGKTISPSEGHFTSCEATFTVRRTFTARSAFIARRAFHRAKKGKKVKIDESG
jgi:hypothetical protein